SSRGVPKRPSVKCATILLSGAPMAAIPPSGRQYVISHGTRRAVITEVGGGLRTYTVDGEDVIDGYAEDEMCSVARGAPLLPWPNRLQDGRYEFADVTHQTPLTEPDRRNAIHGLTRWLSWKARDQGADRVVMELLLHPQERGRCPRAPADRTGEARHRVCQPDFRRRRTHPG